MTTTKPIIRYEDNAEQATVTGWCCKTCRRFWSKDEHMARYCCATETACACGNRIDSRSWTACDSCRAKKRAKDWTALPRVDWDGTTPVCEYDGDRYYFDADAIAQAIGEHLDLGWPLDTFRVVLCEPNNGSHFEMADFLADDLPEDYDAPDSEEIDKAVNAWIAAHAPFSWTPTNKAISVESLPVPEPEDDRP